MPKTQTTEKKTSKSNGRSNQKTNQKTKTPGLATQPGARAQSASHAQSARNGRNRQQASGSSKAGEAGDSRLQEFLLDELKDIYWAEQKLVKTLPKLEKAATTKELKQAFSSHLKETEGHVSRLEEVFELLEEEPEAKKCDAMEGITEEGSSVIEDTEDGTATRDVALVLAGQKAEHYEIATYGGLVQLARTLGRDDIAKILAQTLEEEKNADKKLTSIAESKINYEAAGESK
jgi:ferritin-like metal-binding protein YciE